MKRHKNKIKRAIESLEDILERIGPYIPKPPKEEKRKERPWRMAKDVPPQYPNQPKHNQVTSPF